MSVLHVKTQPVSYTSGMHDNVKAFNNRSMSVVQALQLTAEKLPVLSIITISVLFSTIMWHKLQTELGWQGTSERFLSRIFRRLALLRILSAQAPCRRERQSSKMLTCQKICSRTPSTVPHRCSSSSCSDHIVRSATS